MSEKNEPKASEKTVKAAPEKAPSRPERSVHEDLVALVRRYRAEYGGTGVTRLGYTVDGCEIAVDIEESGFTLRVGR